MHGLTGTGEPATGWQKTLYLLCAFIFWSYCASLPSLADEVLRVGIYNNAPKVYTDTSGHPAGIFVDIITTIAREEGWSLRFVRGSWAEGLERLERGEIDLMPDVAFTPERATKYAFHKTPVLSAWDQVYAHRNSGIHSLLDINGKRIAVLEGSVQQETFRQLAKAYGQHITLVPVTDYQAAFTMVSRRQADAVVANNYYGSLHSRAAGLEPTAILLHPCALFYAAPKDADRHILSAIDAHLKAMQNDPHSAYYRSLKRWTDDEVRFRVPPWLPVTAILVGTVLLISLVGSLMLKRQVNARTRALADQNEQMAQINQALQHSERKYRELLEHANSIILRWDCRGCVTFLNEYGQQFFGFTEEDVVGQSVVGTVFPARESTGQEIHALVEQVRRNPNSFERFNCEVMRRNGESAWIAWTNKVYFDDQGQIDGVLSIGTDITERRQAEEALRRLNIELEQKVMERTMDLEAAKERAESADRLKSAFLAAMSHELRTPLNSIIGFTGIVLQQLPGPLNPEQSKQLGMVMGSARHLLDLINDVLDLSKIEAGQLDLECQPFDVHASVRKVMQLVSPLAAQKRLALHEDVSPDVGELIGDRRRFEQILINLLNNAVKFTETGSIRLSCSISDAHLVTRVTDTGMGIKSEDLDKLFHPFQQVDTGLTRNHEGSGLGLSICRKLATMMGGTIWVDSEWGKGSTFTVSLPLDHSQRPTQHVMSPP